MCCKTIGVCVYCIKNTIIYYFFDIDIDCNYCTQSSSLKYPISGGNQNVTIIENWSNTIQVHTINNCTLTYSPYYHQKRKQPNNNYNSSNIISIVIIALIYIYIYHIYYIYTYSRRNKQERNIAIIKDHVYIIPCISL